MPRGRSLIAVQLDLPYRSAGESRADLPAELIKTRFCRCLLVWGFLNQIHDLIKAFLFLRAFHCSARLSQTRLIVLRLGNPPTQPPIYMRTPCAGV